MITLDSVEGATSIVIPSLWVCAGIVLYTGIQALILAYFRRRTLLHLVFAVSCFCAVVYQIALTQYYLTTEIATAATALRWQFGAIIVFLPSFVFFVVLYSSGSMTRPAVVSISAFFLCLLIINALSPYSMRFSTLAYQGALVLPWGESIATFSGTVHPWNKILRVIYGVILSWALWRTVLQYQQGEKRAAIFLAICVLLIIAATIWGGLIDAGYLRTFYIAGYAFLGLALLMSVSLGMDLREHVRRLHVLTGALQDESLLRKEAESALRHIAAGTAAETGARFFQTLASELGAMFKANYIFVGGVRPGNAIQTLGTYPRGTLLEGQTFLLTNTAFDRVLSQQLCVIECDARTDYPLDSILHDLNANAFIATPLLDADGRGQGVLTILHDKPLPNSDTVRDILEICAARAAAEIRRLSAEQHAEHMAYYDYLTGLANRELFHQYLNNALDKAQRENQQGAVLLIDVDHFKTINDALSHEVGDQVLCEVGRRLNAVGNGNAFIARIGGDEFIAVLRPAVCTSRQCASAAYELAQAVCNSLAHDLALGEHVLNIGVSIGIALFPQDEATPQDILRRVDMALYRAKNTGRGLIQFYEAPMQAAAQQRLNLEKGLRAALERKEFELYFQPQLDTQGQVIGAEVLLRWHAPQGEIGPEVFIPVAEESGLIHSVGAWVLESAGARLRRWRDNGALFDGTLSLNVSPWQFARSDFVKQMELMLRSHDADPSRVALELTETALVYDLQDTAKKMQALRSMGIAIALDDFGAGHASLAYIRSLPLDILKIDKAFISDLGTAADRGMVENIVAIGRNMNIQVLAEGVETTAQCEQLTAMGCTQFQGFLFCPPLPEAAFLQWLLSRRETTS